MKKITRGELEHALLVHEDTMKVMRGQKAEYSYLPNERHKARKIILDCTLTRPGRKHPRLKVIE